MMTEPSNPQNSPPTPDDSPMQQDSNTVSSEPPISPIKRRSSMATPISMGIWNSLQTFFAAAIVLATLFTMWNPANLFSNKLFDQTWNAYQTVNEIEPGSGISSTPVATGTGVIGIVAGHYSSDPNQHDPGAVCPDGLEEEQVNYDIAYLVMQKLGQMGYTVDLLQEWDPKLQGYQAMALVSIHNDTCQYLGEDYTGFKVASAIASAIPENDSRLSNCLIDRYQKTTGMLFHFNTITTDMTYYHNFYEVNSQTPAAIIETGFLNLDRVMLTEKKDIVAQGIVDGILCFVRNESVTEYQTNP